MVYSIGRADYMWVSPSLAASEREHTIVLHPELVISGRVTDAETGRLLPNFHLVRGDGRKGRDEIDWSENDRWRSWAVSTEFGWAMPATAR